MVTTRSKSSQILASVLMNAVYTMQNFPIMLVNSMIGPFAFLIVINFISHGSLIGVAIEGAFIMTMVTAGLSLLGDLTHLRNDMRYQDMIVASPTSAFMYIVGMAVSELVYFLPTIVIISVLAVLFLHVPLLSYLVIAVVMLIMFSFSVALAFLFSTFSSDVVQGWAFTALISTLLSTIPPVYYPITYIPLPYRYIAYISPTTYAAQIVQAVAGFVQISGLQMAIDWGILIMVAIVIFIIASKKLQWREK